MFGRYIASWLCLTNITTRNQRARSPDNIHHRRLFGASHDTAHAQRIHASCRVGQSHGQLAGVAFGDADDLTLRRGIRAFGNFIEYVPTCLVMLALAEIAGGPASLLWSLGIVFVAGRVVHALGMLYTQSPAPRALGMFMTYAALLVPAIWLLSHTWS